MATFLILAAMLQTATPAPSPEAGAPPTGMRQGMQRRFEQMDADKDGAVTKAEADAAMAARGQNGGGQGGGGPRGDWFARADADKDGKVTSAEMQQLRAARMRRMEGGGAPQPATTE